MSYTKRSIENLKENINIVDVISRSVPLKRTGNSWKGLCPFHSEKTPSFTVNEEKQFFMCFGCGKHGDLIEFVKDFYNLNFTEAVEKLSDEYGIELEKASGYGEDYGKYYELNREAAYFFYRAFKNHPNPAYEYMKKRRVLPEIMTKFGIGYADDSWDSLLNYMTGRGYDKKMLVELGLVSESKGRFFDKFRNRVIFPIINPSGKVIGFGGRTMEPDGIPKYLNSPETKVFQKKKNLYGLNLSKSDIGKEGFVILTEGYMDTVGLYQSGIKNVAASLGTALTDRQAKLIKRYTENVVLSYDADRAGRAAAVRGMEILRREGLRVKVMHVTEGKDPDEYVKEKGKKAFMNLVKEALPYAEYKIKSACMDFDLTDEEEKIRCAERVAGILEGLDPIERDVYTVKAAKDLDVSEAALRKEVSGSRDKFHDKGNETGRPGLTKNIDEPNEIEKDLIRLVFRNEDYARRMSEEALFSTDAGRRIFDLIYSRVGKGDFNLAAVMDLASDEDRKTISEIVNSIPATGDEEKIFQDCSLRARIYSLRREEERLLTALSMSYDDVNPEVQKKLMRDLKETQAKIEIEKERTREQYGGK
jgi:DNA primase